jgi:hypothetical protein
MKKLIRMLFHWNNKIQDNDCEFTISKDLPEPIRNVKYSDQLMVIKTLKNLTIGSSFPIPNELEYTVRKMRDLYCPEYKIVIRNMGTSKRVYRRA